MIKIKIPVLLTESKLTDLISKYPQFEEEIKKLEASDPTDTKKYLFWMVKQFLNKEPIDEIISLVQQFHQKGQFLQQKDINQYKTLGDLRGSLEDIGNKPSKTETKKQIKVSESTKLFEDQNFLLIRPLSKEASQILGKESKWCISATQTENYWFNYSSKGIKFYFLISKINASRENLFNKIAFSVYSLPK